MKKRTWKTYAVWIILAEAVGALAGWLSREGTELYSSAVQQPMLAPPAQVFPVVWVILYALMGIGAARVYSSPPSKERSRGLLLFFLQLAFNFLWTLVFFNLQAYAFAFFWLLALWVLILLMILNFRKVDPLAARLQIPYLIWSAFASYLNFGVWMLN